MMIAVSLVMAAQAATAAAPPPRCWPPTDGDADASAAATAAMPIAASAERVALVAQQLSGDATVQAAMRAVRVVGTEGEAPTVAAAEQALASLGFETVLDLRLLAGGPEAAELMAELRTDGGLSIADRAKIRLLVGDREHLARVCMPSSLASGGPTAVDHDPGVRGVGARGGRNPCLFEALLVPHRGHATFP
eukprot:SAG31_NODE_13940_length_836_cov_1.267300_1_plen_191_part_01